MSIVKKRNETATDTVFSPALPALPLRTRISAVKAEAKKSPRTMMRLQWCETGPWGN